MEATLLKSRLNSAIEAQCPFVLLLRGAHTLEIDSASAIASDGGGQTRFDIQGRIAIDASAPRTGAISVSNDDVASLFVEHDKESA